MIRNIFTQSECSVSLISKHQRILDGNGAQQFLSDRDIMHVSSRKLNVNWISQRVNDRVDLRATPATAHSDAFVLGLVLGIGFPFFVAPALAL